VLTRELLRSLLHYNPETGVFSWRVDRGGKARAGDEAGYLKDGYVRIEIAGKGYRAHRLAYLYMTGTFPDFEVDHEDTNKANNRWRNLRPATRSKNLGNVGLMRTNTSGFKGAMWHKRIRRWQAMICVNRQKFHLGYHDTPEEAHAAYMAAANTHFKEFARAK
jgi:hypothetical protein